MVRRGLRSASIALAIAASSLATLPASAFVWPNVPDHVARALASGDVAERRLAAQRIAELPPELGLSLAQTAMGDTDVEVRLRAAAAVGFRMPRAGDLVVPWLSEGDARLRLAACDVIRAAPTDRSVVALGRVLGDPDPHVRLAAAQALGQSGLVDAVSPLLGHLDDPSPEVRGEVVRALGRIGDPRAVVPLIGKVQDSVPEVRKTVARALGELGDLRAASALMLALQDASGDVRLDAVTALGRLKSDEATPAIAPLVERPDDSGPRSTALATGAEVRAAALRALGRIGSPAAVKVLVAALAKDDPNSIRSPVRDALVAAGWPAVKALIAVLVGAPPPNVAASAALALGALEAKEGVDPIVRAMQRGVVPLRPGLRALARLGSASALPTVLEMLDEADPAVRKEAIAAASALLERVDAPPGGGRVDGRAVDPASSALREPGTPLDEKIELVKLLGKTGAARAQTVLLPLVTAKQPALRLAAIDALGSLGSSSPVVDAALLKALDDESSDARLRAATSLAKIGGAPVAKQLLERLAVSAEQDRGAIGIALSGTLARATDGTLATAAEKAVETAPDAARDGLIEGLGRMRGDAAAASLTALAARGIDDRRKVAEALAGHAELAPVARKLALDPDAGVRANAIWSLGAVGGRGDVPLLARALHDVDASVAGDAAASIGRVAAKERDPASAKPLCAALSDARPYVRANAVLAISLASSSCDGAAPGPRAGGAPEVRPHELFPTAADLVARDPSEAVRLAAASALARDLARGGATATAASRALVRCSAEDHDAAVATRCSRGAVLPTGVDDVSVYVVADGRTAPQPRGAFALERADGLLRLGVADRRGSFFEAAAPRGAIRLAVPAPLAR